MGHVGQGGWEGLFPPWLGCSVLCASSSSCRGDDLRGCGAVMALTDPWCWVGSGLALPTCVALSVTGPRSDVLCEPFQTVPVSSSRDGDAAGVRSCCAACCWLLYLCHCCRGWGVTPMSQCTSGAISDRDQGFAFLSQLLFFSGVSRWFWFVSLWLGMVALSHCPCLHAAPQLLL